MISWYTRIFNGLHYGHKGRDITWSNSSLFCTLAGKIDILGRVIQVILT